jgi:hypothetical protein
MKVLKPHYNFFFSDKEHTNFISVGDFLPFEVH